MIEPKWIGQRHWWGCQVACLAMCIGKSYDQTLELYPHLWKLQEGIDDGRRGVGMYQVQDLVLNHGLRIAYVVTYVNTRTLAPNPISGIIWSRVEYPDGNSHSVIRLLKHGIVLDPANPYPQHVLDYQRISVDTVIMGTLK
jgi:hypothetical protein